MSQSQRSPEHPTNGRAADQSSNDQPSGQSKEERNSQEEAAEERRIEERKTVNIPATVIVREAPLPARILDLSASGARIEDCEQRPEEGTPISLKFSFFEGTDPQTLPAKVVRETSTGGFAVEFQRLDPRTKEILRMVRNVRAARSR